jgi:hypothetical protein
MDTAEQELERTLLNLANLNHVGMALFQFAKGLSNERVRKTEDGGFRLGVLGAGFVEFRFQEGEEKIRMYVNLEISTIEKRDGRFLPVNDGSPYPVCEISRPNQLASAARYIETAHVKYLRTRSTSSDSSDRSVN